MRVRPTMEVGFRFQLLATWPVGFVTTFDYFPDDETWYATVTARIGL